MTKVKGSNLKYARDFACDRGGEAAWLALLSTLSAEDRTSVQSTLASSWCDLSLQHRVFNALDASITASSSEDVISEFAEYVAQMDLTRVHRLFLRLRSPAYILEKTGEYWSRFYDEGEWRVTRIGTDAARAELHGIIDCEPIFCRFIQAYIRSMFRIVGATSGLIRHSQCVCSGARCCVYEGRWRE